MQNTAKYRRKGSPKVSSCQMIFHFHDLLRSTFNFYLVLTINHQGPFFCDKCGSICRDRSSLLRHFRFKHLQKRLRRPSKRVSSCDVCGYANSMTRLFRLHMSKHRLKTQCKICNKTFVNIDSHLQVHAKATFLVDDENSREKLILQSRVIPNDGKRVLRR